MADPTDADLAAFFDAHAALEAAKLTFRGGGTLTDTERTALADTHGDVLDRALTQATDARDAAAGHLHSIVTRQAAGEPVTAELADANAIYRYCSVEYEFFAGRRRLLDHIAAGQIPIDQLLGGTPTDEQVHGWLVERRAARSRGDVDEMRRLEALVTAAGYQFEDLPHDHVAVTAPAGSAA